MDAVWLTVLIGESALAGVTVVEKMLFGLMTSSSVLMTVQVVAGVLIVPDVMVGVGLNVLMATVPVFVMWLMTFATGP